jgi:hypothetical protein
VIVSEPARHNVDDAVSSERERALRSDALASRERIIDAAAALAGGVLPEGAAAKRDAWRAALTPEAVLVMPQ